jgi:hypothetical protein
MDALLHDIQRHCDELEGSPKKIFLNTVSRFITESTNCLSARASGDAQENDGVAREDQSFVSNCIDGWCQSQYVGVEGATNLAYSMLKRSTGVIIYLISRSAQTSS